MNIDGLLKRYFGNSSKLPVIEMFDDESIHAVYKDIVNTLKLHSGKHILTYNGVEERVEETSFWQGTIIYFELYSNKDIDPNKVLENRTDAVSEFNDEFLDTEDIDNLW